MKTTLSSAAPAELATEALVAVVLDYCDSSQTAKSKSSQEKQQLKVETSDAAVQAAAADLLSSGEVTCKPFEINLLHKPAQLKAKRLLLVRPDDRPHVDEHDDGEQYATAPPG